MYKLHFDNFLINEHDDDDDDNIEKYSQDMSHSQGPNFGKFVFIWPCCNYR